MADTLTSPFGAEIKDHEFEASLGYRGKSCVTNKRRIKKRR